MLLSCFSHAEIWHLGANMIVFWSFAPLIHHLLGTEQFVGFYVTGGNIYDWLHIPVLILNCGLSYKFFCNHSSLFVVFSQSLSISDTAQYVF